MFFRDRLKALRQQKQLTQEELSKATGITKSAIGMYESGKREPKYETLEILADYFNAPLDVLLGRDTSKIPVSLSADTVREIQPTSAENLHLVAILRGLQSAINAALERAVADIMRDGGEILTAERNRRIKKDSTTSDAG